MVKTKIERKIAQNDIAQHDITQDIMQHDNE